MTRLPARTPDIQDTIQDTSQDTSQDTARDTVTFGVAIAIPEPHATILTGWRRRVGDPEADKIWPHVTLLPPTTVPAERADDVRAHLAQAATAVEPFTMHLFGTGTFRPVSPVVFIQVARGLADCELLEQRVRRGPLERRLEFPYHPHVTVAHDVDEAALDEAYDGLAGFLARFPIDRVSLFQRDAEGWWRADSEYAMGAAAVG